MEFTLDQILTATGGTLHNADARSPAAGPAPLTDRPLSIRTDSREVTADSVFWALRGAVHDGHDFVPSVSGRVACCVVERRWLTAQSAPSFAPVVVVDDSLAALGALAGWNRRRGPVQVVGVTGSFGKTTTREAIHQVVSGRFCSHRSPRNFNNQFGVPLTLLGITPHTELAVVELGASATGEIAQLCRIAAPDIGVITGIGQAHVAEFGGPAAIVAAKGELAAALPGRGVLFLWGDDPKSPELAARACCRIVRVGLGPHNDLRADSVVQNGAVLEIRLEGTTLRIPVLGRHFARAILLAVAVGRDAGVSLAEAAERLAGFRPVPGRGAVEQIADWTVIDDSYNANPEAMQAAIAVLGGLDTGGQRILITGDMLELGDRSAVRHEEVGVSAAAAGVDHVLALGQYARDVVSGARQAGMDTLRARAFDSHAALTGHLEKILSPKDALLVKGSRAAAMEHVIDWLRTAAGNTTSPAQSSLAQSSTAQPSLTQPFRPQPSLPEPS